MKKEEILEYLKSDKTGNPDRVRKLYCGDKVFIRGIIVFSDHCYRSCLYCGLRRENKNLRYRMTVGEVRISQTDN